MRVNSKLCALHEDLEGQEAAGIEHGFRKLCKMCLQKGNSPTSLLLLCMGTSLLCAFPWREVSAFLN